MRLAWINSFAFKERARTARRADLPGLECFLVSSRMTTRQLKPFSLGPSSLPKMWLSGWRFQLLDSTLQPGTLQSGAHKSKPPYWSELHGQIRPQIPVTG